MYSKFSNLKLNYKIWLENDKNQGVLGDGKWQLLKAIQETGSLKTAIEKLELSYRKTWNNLRQIEDLLGFPILETSRGGTEGGNTTLTLEGERIVKAFDHFHSEFDIYIKQAFDKLLHELNNE